MPRKGRFHKRILRSGLEDRVKADLTRREIKHGYETIKLTYVKSSCPNCGCQFSTGTYTPDFIIPRASGIRLVVECKGYFPSSDRTKMQRVGRDNPKEDIRLLFQRDQPIRKGSSTTYLMWAAKNGFPAAVGDSIPESWILDEGKTPPQQYGIQADTKRQNRKSSKVPSKKART